MQKVLWWTGLLGIVAVGVALAAIKSENRRGLWLDEVYSLVLSRGEGYAHRGLPVDEPLDASPAELTRPPEALKPLGVWRGQYADSHPPLYFLLLHGWRWLLGGGAETARVLSLVLFGLAVAMTAAAARSLGAGRGGALVAAGVLAAAGPATWYAAEIRGYVLGMLLSAVMLWALGRVVRRPGVLSGSLYVGSVVAMGLTHYFLAGVAAGAWAGAWLGAMVGARDGRARALAAAGACAAVVYALVWGGGLAAQWAVREGFSGWITEWGELPLWLAAVLATGAMSRVLGGPADFTGAASGLAIVAALVLATWRDRGRPWAWGMPMLLGGAAGAVLLPLASDLVLGSVHLFHVRYVLFAVVPLAVSGGLIWSLGGLWRGLGAAMLGVALLGQLEPWATEGDWQSVGQAVERALDGGPGASGEATGLAFVVARADDVARRRDIETDVRLLAVLVEANRVRERRVARPVALTVLFEPAGEGLNVTELAQRWPGVRRWVVVSAWRHGEGGGDIEGWWVRHVEVWPQMNVRLVVFERSGMRGSEGREGSAGGTPAVQPARSSLSRSRAG